MTEHKLTDEEVIKALEWCRTAKLVTMKFFKCDRPLEITTTEKEICFGDVLDLINRRKAEIDFWMDEAANAKKEAVNEFAERLKNYAEVVTTLSDDETILAIQDHFVDEVTEEMIGEQK